MTSHRDRITPDIDRQLRLLERLPRDAYEHWRSITPVDTGRARRSTRLRGDTIVARYPYAERLDQGYSKQAPDGMSKPTEKFVEQRIEKISRKGRD